MIIQAAEITAVILAGGRGRRMGGKDKGLVVVNNLPLIEHVISAVSPQAGQLVINANRNIEEYQHYGFPVVSDTMADYQGPLAGFASTMAAAETDYIVTIPCDSPLLPADLVQRLVDALQNEDAELAVAHDGERLQPVFALIRVSLLPSLLDFLQRGDRKIDLWYAQHKMAKADFSDIPETFLNINTPGDQEQVQRHERLK
ncbi:MAG: molybdenum cofactor guanylyltransferase MobA [Pseudomonadota bacterium]|nr:molybdenum cofactor guanylyltransferase MobA [Pseudomonadota bacterium]